MGIRDGKNIGGFVNCAIDDEVSRRGGLSGLSPRERSVDASGFMTHHRRLRFVMFIGEQHPNEGTTIETEHPNRQSAALDAMRRPGERRFGLRARARRRPRRPRRAVARAWSSATSAEDDDAANAAAVDSARVRNLCARDASCSYVGDGRGSNDAGGADGDDGDALTTTSGLGAYPRGGQGVSDSAGG